MFDDFRFAHTVLGSLGGSGNNQLAAQSHRDAFVFTLDYPDTYEIYGKPGSPEWKWRYP